MTAAEIAQTAEFCRFGPNDLTHRTVGVVGEPPTAAGEPPALPVAATIPAAFGRRMPSSIPDRQRTRQLVATFEKAAREKGFENLVYLDVLNPDPTCP